MKEEGGAVELKRGTKEFDEVAATFLATMTERGRAEVTRVHRIENAELYEGYRLRLAQTARKHARRENRKTPVDESTLERRLYHGTDRQSAQAICSTGFNRSYCTRAVHGKGVYFASRSSYSAHPSFAKPSAADGGTQTIILARVITGAVARSSPDYVAPPAHHDSVADNPADPQVVVVFHDAACYPEYVIEFNTESSQQLLQAQVGAAVNGIFGAGSNGGFGFGVGFGQVMGGTGGGGFTFGGSGGGAAVGGFNFGGGNIAQPSNTHNNGAFAGGFTFGGAAGGFNFGGAAPAWPGNANTAPVNFTDGVGAFEALAASAAGAAAPSSALPQADLGFGAPEPTPYDSNKWMAST